MVRVTIDESLPEDLSFITLAALDFFVQNFMDPKAAKAVKHITVKVDKVEGGDVAQVDAINYPEKLAKPKKYNIVLGHKYKDIQIDRYLRTLFHEMKHIEQYASGRLGYTKRDWDWKWLGKRWSTESEYWLQPWEQEAQGVELSALMLFQKHFPEFRVLTGRKPKYNGRAKSGWKPLQIQPLTNPVKSKT